MSYRRSGAGMVIILMIIAVFGAQAKDAKNAPPSEKIPSGAKVFVAPIADGFDTFLKDAVAKKKVPVELVASRDQADYEISGTAESQKAGAAKKIIFGNWPIGLLLLAVAAVAGYLIFWDLSRRGWQALSGTDEPAVTLKMETAQSQKNI